MSNTPNQQINCPHNGTSPGCDERCVIKKEKGNYISHFHCWDQTQPSACGQPIESHTQCCLCDTPYNPNKKVELSECCEKCYEWSDPVKDPEGPFCSNTKCECHPIQEREEKANCIYKNEDCPICPKQKDHSTCCQFPDEAEKIPKDVMDIYDSRLSPPQDRASEVKEKCECEQDGFMGEISTIKCKLHNEYECPYQNPICNIKGCSYKHSNPRNSNEWNKEELRQYIDKFLKPKKQGIKNLDREIIINYVDSLISSTRRENWIDVKKDIPQVGVPVLVALGWFESKRIVYAVLKKVNGDDHDWEVADDDSEISHALIPIAWQPITPYQLNNKKM